MPSAPCPLRGLGSQARSQIRYGRACPGAGHTNLGNLGRTGSDLYRLAFRIPYNANRKDFVQSWPGHRRFSFWGWLLAAS